MKKIAYIILSCAAISLAATGCAKQGGDPYSDSAKKDIFEVTCYAPTCSTESTDIALFNPGTKTTRAETGETYWLPGDKINLFQGAMGRSEFTAQITEPSLISQFGGSISVVTATSLDGASAMDFWAVYPYNAGNYCDGECVTLNVHNTQTSADGTFASGEFPMIGKSPDLGIAFSCLCSGIAFTVNNPGIVSVTFRGNNSEDIAGTVRAKFAVVEDREEPVVDSFVIPKQSVTIVAPTDEGFKTGTKYYMTLLPATFTNGFRVTFTQKRIVDGETKTYEATYVYSDNVTFKRAAFKLLVDKDKDLEFVEIAKPGTNQIIYTSTDGTKVNPNPSGFGDATIISNDLYGEKGILTFDKDVSEIGEDAFAYCENLASIDLPETVSSIGNWAFCSCRNLTSIRIPEGVKSIGMSAFSTCNSLAEIKLPAGVSSIGEYAFSECSSITSVNIPMGVSMIGYSTFANCSNLRSVTIPESVTQIGYGAFYNCTNLKSVNLPSQLDVIESDLFNGCSSLTSITIPEGVTSIGSTAFYYCSSLESVNIPEEVTSIGSGAFYGCCKITSIDLPEKLTSIQDFAFQECGFTSITIPQNTNFLGCGVFCDCAKLKTAYCKAAVPPTLSRFFPSPLFPDITTIYVPTASLETYKEQWSEYAEQLEGYDF